MTGQHCAEQSRKQNVERAIRWGALGIGIVLFFGTLYYINFRLAFGTIRRLGYALPLALLFSGLWHLVRTWAWAQCFPQPRTVSFARLARVRLAAEAFSYLTLRGIAGEPLKVVLLGNGVNAKEATAAVALERIAYMIGTTVIVGIASVLALVWLPLTPAWFRVFRAFALVAGAVTLLAAMVISGRGAYVQTWLARIDRGLGTSIARGPVARFIGAVESLVLDLVRGNPKRLVVLLTATVAAYVCMALEAWVILRASGAPISPNGAFAVETFSRVASFASAFIPANLGALEASSLAAVTAVGAVGGGAALALARRLRGLFWAGLGLAIYPRGARAAAPADAGTPLPDPARRATLLYVAHDSHGVNDTDVQVPASARIAGLPIGERVLRPAQRAGYSRVIVWAPRGDSRRDAMIQRLAPSAIIATTETEWREALSRLEPTDPVTAVGPGTVASTALLSDALALPATPGTVRDVPCGPEWPESGVLRLAAADALDIRTVVAELRHRRERALPLPNGTDVSQGGARLAMRIRTPDDLARAETTIRLSSYKEADAKVARFNRRISLPISVALIRTPLTANQLSVILVAVGFYSAWLFSIGHYWTGVLAAFLSLAASILDGCDGEIARLKYQESALGCWIETVGDYSYYIAIFIGMSIGAVRQTGWDGFYWVGAVAVGSTLLTFALLIYLRGRITGNNPEKLSAIAGSRFQADASLLVRIIWRFQFVATRAAMPYGIMVFSLLAILPGIVVLAAIGANIYWVTLVVKLRDIMGKDDEEQSVAA